MISFKQITLPPSVLLLIQDELKEESRKSFSAYFLPSTGTSNLWSHILCHNAVHRVRISSQWAAGIVSSGGRVGILVMAFL